MKPETIKFDIYAQRVVATLISIETGDVGFDYNAFHTPATASMSATACICGHAALQDKTRDGRIESGAYAATNAFLSDHEVPDHGLAVSFVWSLAGATRISKPYREQFESYHEYIIPLLEEKKRGEVTAEEAVEILLRFMEGFATPDTYRELTEEWRRYQAFKGEVS